MNWIHLSGGISLVIRIVVISSFFLLPWLICVRINPIFLIFTHWRSFPFLSFTRWFKKIRILYSAFIFLIVLIFLFKSDKSSWHFLHHFLDLRNVFKPFFLLHVNELFATFSIKTLRSIDHMFFCFFFTIKILHSLHSNLFIFQNLIFLFQFFILFQELLVGVDKFLNLFWLVKKIWMYSGWLLLLFCLLCPKSGLDVLYKLGLISWGGSFLVLA